MTMPTVATASVFETDDTAPTRLRWQEPYAPPRDSELTGVLPDPVPELLSETRVQPLRPPPTAAEKNQPFPLVRVTAVPNESGPRVITAPPEHAWRDESEPFASPEEPAHAIVPVAAPTPESRALVVAAMTFTMLLAFALGFAARLMGWV